MNSVLFQYFEWYLKSDGKHWQRLSQDAAHLAHLGINQVWMPPAFKATSKDDVGYGVYDLYDLGEFDQNGTIRTKYGTKQEYIDAIKVLKEHNIKPIADIVLNHKANGDEQETFMAIEMDPTNRQQPISEPFEMTAWTHFYFPGRNKKYTDFEWHWYHFSGTDYNASNHKTGIYMIQGDNKGWAQDNLVDDENGNYDYLMFTDIDFRHPEVREHLDRWVQWFIKETGIEGFRLDAIKHIDSIFIKNFIKNVREIFGEEFYVFGEYWQSDIEKKTHYLENTDFEFDLVDVGLHMNFFEASKKGRDYDLTNILSDSLMQEYPTHAVTFVDNHDTQRGQALESTVEDWFKPLAYAIILLMESGLPCVFYGDYYGIDHPEFGQSSFKEILERLLFIRKEYAYGEEIRYFDHANCIGWVRLGDEEHSDALAIVISNGDEGWKEMSVGKERTGQVFIDLLGHHSDEVIINEDGIGNFPVNAGSVSAWVKK